MSDPATSGESVPASPDTASAATAASGGTQPIGTFGNSRGSGLLRGKRPSAAATPTASSAPAGYQPSSIEVITTKSEYKNPFTGESSVPAPVVNEPAPQAAPPAADVSPAISIPAQVATKEAGPAPGAVTPELFPLQDATPVASPAPALPEVRAELKILPPAESKRPAQSWESDSQPRRDERPDFRPERRETRKFEPRAPREPMPEQRGPLPREAHAHQPKKSGGILAWFKSLFGGKTEPTAAPSRTEEFRHDRDGEHRQGRRRHRGGRGRHQNYNGPREGQQPQGDRPQGGEQRQGDGGGQRRRRRGGRGRYRGEGGDRGGDYQTDGHQGGGAI